MAHGHRARRAYLEMIDRVTGRWLELFAGNTELYSTAYWDLLTALWSADAPVRKTDALAAIKGIKSAHTAGKYVDAAIRLGLVVETENPADARSKLLRLAPDMREHLDRFFDQALDEVEATAQRVARQRAAEDRR
ncbi:hypothetical protein [Ferruginivarius sediminum]|uniref:MarR family transcriptional regulator n=1 Tax=Ferruginivarius sediminum TaxID=2661937 RepID=A0A369TBX8_9PROT|nr:hypothetical protein [Ferruginivarius sediminum]RDD62851.1 hypothetical protein DRB17_06755 [Ferruginivarius sediminum]